MHLMLCSYSDAPALWAFEGLRAMGLNSLELVTTEMLSFTTHWEHRVGNTGCSLSFKRPDGRTFQDRNIGGVVNRLMAPPADAVAHAVPSDRDYALQEMSAFYLSWLQALPGPVLNRPTPQGLAGRWFHSSEWALLAHQAGLCAPAWRQTDSDRAEDGYASMAPAGVASAQVVVLDDELFGASAPAEVRSACVSLAKLSQTRLLGIDFYETRENPWTFAYATPTPNLQIGGPPLLRSLARIFENGERQ
jgi:hypothetical protein